MSIDFNLCAFFKYIWNPSFLIAFSFPLATACTGITKVSWKVFLKIPEKFYLHPQNHFWNPKWNKEVSKIPSCVLVWWNLLQSSGCSYPNPFIWYIHVRVLRDPSRSVMFPGSKQYRNTTSNGVSGSIVWSNCCASREHEFTNWQFLQALMNWYNLLLTNGQDCIHSSSMGNGGVVVLLICPAFTITVGISSLYFRFFRSVPGAYAPV